MRFFFSLIQKPSDEKSCLLAVIEQNFSKYFAEAFIFGSVALLIHRRQHSEPNDKFSEGSPGNFPSTFLFF